MAILKNASGSDAKVPNFGEASASLPLRFLTSPPTAIIIGRCPILAPEAPTFSRAVDIYRIPVAKKRFA